MLYWLIGGYLLGGGYPLCHPFPFSNVRFKYLKLDETVTLRPVLFSYSIMKTFSFLLSANRTTFSKKKKKKRSAAFNPYLPNVTFLYPQKIKLQVC